MDLTTIARRLDELERARNQDKAGFLGMTEDGRLRGEGYLAACVVSELLRLGSGAQFDSDQYKEWLDCSVRAVALTIP